ncbi:hypothetical protein P7C73_g1037, partial [Tremellales sp. Uapishka_1]
MSTKDLERVDSLSTCEVSDVLIKLGFPHGGLITDLTMFSGRGTISGPVFTVKVFARHHSTLGPATFTRPSAFAQAITVDPLPPLSEPPFPSITVQSGDILLCDEDGCVAIPVEIVTEVVEKALAAREIDDNVRRDLLQGKGVQESMQRWRGKV